MATSRRGPPRPATLLLEIPRVPAGVFDVFAEAKPGVTLAGTAVVRLGRIELPLETWTFDQRPSGFTGLVLDVPVLAHSITVTGDEAATATIGTLALRPRSLASPGRAIKAVRGMRAGHVRALALDDQAYLEPGAIWVRGEQTATFVIANDVGSEAVLRVKAGAVANEVDLAAGAWGRRLSLQAEQSVDVTLPDAALAPFVLRVTSGSGFRPSSDGTGDVRWLGVYLTFPEPPVEAPPAR